jgi:5-methylcytosine-specific restriction protein B
MINSDIQNLLEEISKKNIEDSFSLLQSEGIPPERRSKEFDVVDSHSGLKYPPPIVIEKAYKIATNKSLPNDFFQNIGLKSPHFLFLKKMGFQIVSKKNGAMNYKNVMIKKIKDQDISGELYIPKKFVGIDNYFPDPRINDPNPIGENPNLLKLKMRWDGIDSEYRSYDLKNFRKEFHSNNDTRIAGSPKLKIGDIIVFIKNEDSSFIVKTIDNRSDCYSDFLALLDMESYKLMSTDNFNAVINSKINGMNTPPLNQILYGPPGTGKTYITILKSLSILGIDYTDYADALEKFQQELGNRIEFVSMHQSFSYEDFVQGLRPKSINGTVQFDYVDGVFKKICTRATEAITGDRSEVSSSQISNYEIALIAFFLSKFNGKRKDQKQGVELLGYESDDEAFRLIGEKIGLKPNSLKNHRDKFDFIFKDRPGYTSRKGWTPRNGEEKLDNTSSWPYHDIYIELKNIEINELAERIISILKKFETPAITNPDGGNFVIVLDEINRANISKVFGELITLIEEDKRDAFTVRLPSGELFAVPNNLFIIGTMNTADKSVSMVDIALRRRFEFEAMYPRPDLVEDKEKRDFMDSLNLAILEKKGIDFQIGHSDFMKSLDLTAIINRKIIPLLMEYFRNRHEEVTEILKICLPGSIKIDEELLKWKQVKVINKG